MVAAIFEVPFWAAPLWGLLWAYPFWRDTYVRGL